MGAPTCSPTCPLTLPTVPPSVYYMGDPTGTPKCTLEESISETTASHREGGFRTEISERGTKDIKSCQPSNFNQVNFFPLKCTFICTLICTPYLYIISQFLLLVKFSLLSNFKCTLKCTLYGEAGCTLWIAAAAKAVRASNAKAPGQKAWGSCF